MTAPRVSSGPPGALSTVRCALALGAVLLFFTMLVDYLFLAHSGPKPLYFMLGLGVAAAGLVAVEPRRPMPLLGSPLLAWIGLYFLMTTLWGISMENRPGVVQVLVDRYRSMFFLAACAALFDEGRARRVAMLAVAAAAVGASALNVAETLGAVRDLDTLNRVAGRSAGFYLNPNDSGLAIVFGLAVSVPALPKRWRVPLLVAGAVGVAATFSRGALSCLALLLLWLLWRREVGLGPAAVAAGLVAASLALGGNRAVAFLDSHSVLNDDTWARLRFAADDSGRGEVALKAWRMFADAPLLGNGLGASRTWDAPEYTHNMYLSLAVDHGVLGLLLFPALALALAAGRRPSPLGPVLLLAGFFSHNLLEAGPALVCIALSAPCAPRPASLAGHEATLPQRAGAT